MGRGVAGVEGRKTEGGGGGLSQIFGVDYPESTLLCLKSGRRVARVSRIR